MDKKLRYGHCKFCGGTHPFLKSMCPAYQLKCTKCNGFNHLEQFCSNDKQTAFKSNTIATQQKMILCKYCGETHVMDQTKCPAIGKFCANCGVKNHMEKICPQKLTGNHALKVNKSVKPPLPKKQCTHCRNSNHTEENCVNKNITEKNVIVNKIEDKTQETKFCNFCAKEHSIAKGSCKAYGKICSYCKKKNHTIEACSVLKRAKQNKLFKPNVKGNSLTGTLSTSRFFSMESLNIPLNSQGNVLEKTTEVQKDTNSNVKIVTMNKKGANKKLKKKKVDSSSDSDNDQSERNANKAKKLIEVASFYTMWQEYDKAKEYLIKAKLLSSHKEVDEKLEEVTILMKKSLS